MPKFEIIKGGASADADKTNPAAEQFYKDTWKIIKENSGLSEEELFIARKIMREVTEKGEQDYVGKEKEVYDKIKTFLPEPPQGPFSPSSGAFEEEIEEPEDIEYKKAA